jgi:hypothetical protein
MWLSLHPIPFVAEAREASLRSRRLGLLGCHIFPRGGDVEGLRRPYTSLGTVADSRGDMTF